MQLLGLVMPHYIIIIILVLQPNVAVIKLQHTLSDRDGKAIKLWDYLPEMLGLNLDRDTH
jgi:hypothetical protein